MPERQTWRELLGRLIESPEEKLRIASELGVSMITLTRWVNNETRPRPHNLRLLLNVLPEHRTVLRTLIAEEFEEFVDEELIIVERRAQEIPATFYAYALRANANLPQILRFESMCDIILQQAVKQLDPNRVGMQSVVTCCLFHTDEQKIHSLRKCAQWGTPPLDEDVGQYVLLWGAESLAGYAVTYARLLAIQTEEEGKRLFPFVWREGRQSAVASPIMRGGRIAGALVVFCTQPGYFIPSRLELIQKYTDMMVLAFNTEDFYAPEQIELSVMPPQHIQLQHVANFRQRVSNVMIQTGKDHRRLNHVEAERLVLQSVEKELLKIITEE